MKKPTILAALLGVFAMVSVAGAQEIGVSFDEDGTVTLAPLGVGGVFNVYVVGYGLPEVFGYEFQLHIDGAVPGGNLAPVVYGPAPQNFGDSTINEIRAGTGGCVSLPVEMGPSPDSWTLTAFGLFFFAPADNVYFCVGPAPSGGAVPQFTICDIDATAFGMIPHWFDLAGFAPDGCAVANPTLGQEFVDAPTTSWGSLKAGF